MRYFRPAALYVPLVLAGCSGTQLTYNTVDLAKTVQDLYTKQALNNLSETIDEPFATPSQMDIQTGTITTGNGVTPSVTFPLSSTAAQTIGAAGVLTGGNRSTAGAGATLSGTQTWQQNWNVLPLSDANTLRNLRALYRYAIFGSDLKSEYFIPRIEKNDKLVDDPYFMQYPQCVLCTNKRAVNPHLHANWLYWTAGGQGLSERSPPKDAPVVDLGQFRSHELYMLRSDFEAGYLSDFVLFLLPNAEPISQGGSAGSSSPTPGRRTPNSPGRPNYGFPPQPVAPISAGAQ